ncbi:MAG: phosphopantetheine-binding protein [Candidatus Sulfotelmatobacter sp.]
MTEVVDFQQAVAALSPSQREMLANRLRLVSEQDSDAVGHERLLAYVVPKPNRHPSVAELLRFLREQLPDYMVPSDCVVLDEWPKTPGGKIDLQILSRPRTTPLQSKAAYMPPQNALEQVIAGIWQEALPVAEIGRNDNFFDLGGHSLLLIQVNRKLKDHCLKDIPLVEMFKYPTISALAEFLNGRRDFDSLNSFRNIQERAANRREMSQQQRARRQEYRSHRGSKELA